VTAGVAPAGRIPPWLWPGTAIVAMLALATLAVPAQAEDEDRALASVVQPSGAPRSASVSAAPRPVGQPRSRDLEQLDWDRRLDSPARWAPVPWAPDQAALLEDARQGRWTQIAAAFKAGHATVNPRDAHGDHLLVLAARAGQDDLVRTLIRRGAVIDHVGSDGFTALGAAAFAGQRSTLRLLLRHGADPAVRGAGGQTVLHLAAVAGQLDIIDELVRQRVDLELLNTQRESVLDLAATHGQLAVMDRLLKAGADLSNAGRR